MEFNYQFLATILRPSEEAINAAAKRIEERLAQAERARQLTQQVLLKASGQPPLVGSFPHEPEAPPKAHAPVADHGKPPLLAPPAPESEA